MPNSTKSDNPEDTHSYQFVLQPKYVPTCRLSAHRHSNNKLTNMTIHLVTATTDRERQPSFEPQLHPLVREVWDVERKSLEGGNLFQM